MVIYSRRRKKKRKCIVDYAHDCNQHQRNKRLERIAESFSGDVFAAAAAELGPFVTLSLRVVRRDRARTAEQGGSFSSLGLGSVAMTGTVEVGIFVDEYKACRSMFASATP